MPDCTADQLTAGIARAIAARDFQAVKGLLMMLAVKDPEQAELVYGSIMAVLEARRG